MKDWLRALAVSSLAALAPIHTIMISVGVLVFADLITGIWAAVKRGESIKSSAMRRTISKLVIYQIAIISGFLVQQYLMDDIIPIVKLLASIIGMVELKSVLENANSVAGGDIFKIALQKLGSDNDKKEQ